MFRKFKLKGLLAVTLVSVITLSGCFGGGDNKDGGKSEYSLKISTVLSDNDPIVVGLEKMAEEVKNETNGEVVIEIYPSSQLGDTNDVLEQAKSGSNVGVLVDTGVLADYVPDMAIYSGPYMFDDITQARKFIDTDIFAKWNADLAAHGLRNLGCNWYQGARNFVTNKKVTQPSDLNGIRVRTMGSTVAQESMKAMGAIPTSLAWSEAYSGLQSKVIDSVEAQITAVYSSSLQEVTKYVSETEHFLLYTGLVISEKWYKTLPEEYQKVVLSKSIESGDYATEITIDAEDKYKSEMIADGMEFIEVDKELFKKASESVYTKMGWEDLKREIDAQTKK